MCKAVLGLSLLPVEDILHRQIARSANLFTSQTWLYFEVYLQTGMVVLAEWTGV